MNNELISVIIPMYNTEQYITECLQSVQRQTDSNFECVIVDDGSTDLSAEKVAEFVRQDSRFRLISQPHAGVSAAVSNGIANAGGPWLYFLDSDDWIDADELQRLYALVTRNNCDMAVTNYIVEGQRSEVLPIVRFNGTVEKKDFPALFYPQFVCNARYCGVVCGNTRGGKLVRKTLAEKNARFQEGMAFAEDAVLMLGILCDCDRVCADLTHTGYHYRMRESSSMHSYGSSYVTHRMVYAQRLRALYNEKGLSGDPRLEENYVCFCFYNALGSLYAVDFDMEGLKKQSPQTSEWIQETIRSLSRGDRRMLSTRDAIVFWLLSKGMYGPVRAMYRINHFLRYTLKAR